MRIALILSLVINAFLVFAFASNSIFDDGPAWQDRDGPRGGMRGGGPEELFSPDVMRALPEESQQQIREEIRSRLPDARQLYQQTSVLREEALDLLVQPDFDEQAFREKSQEMSALHASGRDLMTDTMIEIIATLPQEDRIALAEQIKERREKMRQRFKEHMKGKMDSDRPGGPPPPPGDERRDGPPPEPEGGGF